MNGMFFALAFIAAANPKLLAIDLLLIENRRPRAMFTSILAAGIATGVTVGLIIVFALHPHNYRTERQASAGVDLALGLILLLIGGLVMTGLLARIWSRRSQSRRRSEKKRKNGTDWAHRALREPRLGVAFFVGFICGLPGAAYLSALHNLVTGKWSTGTQAAGVIVFVIIEFLLIIVPWLLLEIRPVSTARALRRTLAWFTAYAMALIAWICILLGAYLTVSGLVRLLSL